MHKCLLNGGYERLFLEAFERCVNRSMALMARWRLLQLGPLT